MAESLPIRIDSDVKTELESLRDNQLRVKTHSNAIEKLITYYKNNEQQKREDFEKGQAEKKRQEQTMVTLGSELKQEYIELGMELGLKSEGTILQFLLEHFKNSSSIDKETLKTLLYLKA
jgi:glucose-6-phosphate-specific signal transduction histidine kinase